MPKAATVERDAQPEHQDGDDAVAARLAFERAFKLSRKGNRWRVWERKSICVFQRTDGWWGWSIASAGGEVRFPRGGYTDAEWAMGALWDQTEGRRWQW
jgi:hypothetical protein